MRILAFSDIHNNVMAIRRMRNLEANAFDLIICAGDFGSEAFKEIHDILLTFCCPVAYVLGNWDSKVSYDLELGDRSIHLHERPYVSDSAVVIGYSGCESHWGLNYFARKEREALASRHPHYVLQNGILILKKDSTLRGSRRQYVISEFDNDLRSTRKRILAKNEDLLIKRAKRFSTIGLPVVAVSHDRTYRVTEKLPGCILHLFGHRHGFKDSVFQGLRYINVSAIDDRRIVSVVGDEHSARWDAVFNFGTYCKIEIRFDAVSKVECLRLYADHSNIRHHNTRVVPIGDLEYLDRDGGRPPVDRLCWFHAGERAKDH